MRANGRAGGRETKGAMGGDRARLSACERADAGRKQRRWRAHACVSARRGHAQGRLRPGRQACVRTTSAPTCARARARARAQARTSARAACVCARARARARVPRRLRIAPPCCATTHLRDRVDAAVAVRRRAAAAAVAAGGAGRAAAARKGRARAAAARAGAAGGRELQGRREHGGPRARRRRAHLLLREGEHFGCATQEGRRPAAREGRAGASRCRRGRDAERIARRVG